MIEFTIRIKEIAPGKFDVRSQGKGTATEGEFELGEKLRDGIQQVMRRELAKAGNGTELSRNSPTHGQPAQES